MGPQTHNPFGTGLAADARALMGFAADHPWELAVAALASVAALLALAFLAGRFYARFIRRDPKRERFMTPAEIRREGFTR